LKERKEKRKEKSSFLSASKAVIGTVDIVLVVF
jgi:hypothetical protein